MFLSSLTTIDHVIIILYFVVVLWIGFRTAKKTKSGDDLFLAGRTLTWGFIGLSLFASNISSTTLVGLAGQAYSNGISVSNYEWMATLVLIFMAIFFIPFYIKLRLTTIPEFLEKRFDSRVRKYFSAMTILLIIIVDTAGSLYAGALVIKVLFPSLAIWQICIALALFAGLYTAAGGLAAVVYTDALQAIILLIGSGVVAVLVFAQFDFSWTAAMAAVPPGHLSVMRPLDDPALPWLGTIIGVPILGFYFWSTNQFIAQRILGAKNLRHARWGAMLCGFLKLSVLFLMVLPGVMALNLYPNLETPDLVFPTIVTNLLPTGIVGLVLAALIAAIMSSIDSTLNSASTLVVMDFISPKRPELTPKQIRNYGRITTILFMAFAAAWAPTIQEYPGLFAYLQQALSYVVPPVVAIFILGIFWKRGTGTAALATLIGGHSLSIAVYVLSQMGMVNLHFTIIAGILTLVSGLIFIVTSLMSMGAASSAPTADVIWKINDARPEIATLPWYLDYRIQSALLLALTAALVIIFW
jgi:SSS family solute:Na+ symporter